MLSMDGVTHFPSNALELFIPIHTIGINLTNLLLNNKGPTKPTSLCFIYFSSIRIQVSGYGCDTKSSPDRTKRGPRAFHALGFQKVESKHTIGQAK